MKIVLASLCIVVLCQQALAARNCDINCAGNCVNNGAGKCDKKCKAGYWLNGDKNCIQRVNCTADAKCLRCMDDGSCRLCSSDCKLSNSLQCVAKTQEELTCDRFCTSACTAGAGKCDSSCQIGFFLEDNVCKSCDPNCDMSSGCASKGAGKCDATCMPGYTLNKSTYNCQPCDLNCDANGCETQGAMKCDIGCKLGYALDKITYWTCVPCDAQCNATAGCSNAGPSLCDGPCNDGYFVDSHGSCVGCDVNCAGKCSAAGKCNGPCKDGYGLFNNICRPCGQNCAGGCATHGAGFCDGPCAPNYYYDSTIHACYPCDPHCTDGCNARGKCNGRCDNGFSFSNGNCI